MDYQKLANLIYPDLEHDCQYYEELYPARDLKEGAEVLRIAPSPTGFVHLGNLYGAIADERVAHLSNGIFYLRIEDTDNKRKVEGAVEAVVNCFDYFGLHFDEGAEQDGPNKYGPYYQRQREQIYKTFAKRLISEGKAYPCFCTEEELNAVREKQEAAKEATGYYGKWATCRNLSYEDIEKHIQNGDPFVIRLKAEGNPEVKHTFHDEIKGDIVVTENNQDIVLIKTDGIPTYHFAHAIDDHLMHTTTVLRGEEWLGSLPVHLELFEKLGFKLPKFAHTTVLMKIDDGVKRKLSKRKDPELALDYYRQLGYHPYAVRIYLMTLLNWNFEQWFLGHPDEDINNFQFSLDKMGNSGALFDLEKLNNICKTYLSKFSLEEMKSYLSTYVKTYHAEDYDTYFSNEKMLDEILTLGMGLNSKKRRKDYIYGQQILDSISIYFNKFYKKEDEFKYDATLTKKLLQQFVDGYNHSDDNNTWFEKVKTIANNNGFAAEMSDYKNNPENYLGSVSDVAETIRIAVTGRKNSPDLWTIMQIIGEEESMNRINNTIKEL